MGDKINTRRVLNQLYLDGRNCVNQCPDEECSKFNVNVVCGGCKIWGEKYNYPDHKCPVPCNIWKR